jgi:hypothetical protein
MDRAAITAISPATRARSTQDEVPTGDLGLLSFGLRHEAHVDYVECQAVDPLHESGQSARIRQLSPEGSGARTYRELAILELCAERGTRLSQKRDLICR